MQVDENEKFLSDLEATGRAMDAYDELTSNRFDGRPRYYDRYGEPIKATEWGEKQANLEYRTVAQHHVDGYFASTVWLGLDHSFPLPGEDGITRPPVIFETMIFQPLTGDEEPLFGRPRELGDDIYQARYATEEQARAGHQHALEWLNDYIVTKRLTEDLGGS
jgi:hypothetical protein